MSLLTFAFHCLILIVAREEGNLPFQCLLSDMLGLTYDGDGVDVEVELVGREAPPAGGAVLEPESGEVGRAKVADST